MKTKRQIEKSSIEAASNRFQLFFPLSFSPHSFPTREKDFEMSVAKYHIQYRSCVLESMTFDSIKSVIR